MIASQPPSGSEEQTPRNILLIHQDEAFAHVLQRVLGEGYSLRHAPSMEMAMSELHAKIWM